MDKIINFKDSENKTFELLIACFDKGDIDGSLLHLNTLTRNSLDLHLVRFRAMLRMKMKGCDLVLDDLLRLFLSKDLDFILFGGTCLLSWFLKENDTELAMHYFEKFKKKVLDIKKDSPELMQGLENFRKDIFKTGFRIVEEDEKESLVLEKASTYLEDGRFEDLISLISEHNFSENRSAHAKNLLSAAAVEIKRLPLAEKSAKEVLLKDPDNVQALCNLAKVYYLKKDKNFENILAQLTDLKTENFSEKMCLMGTYMFVHQSSLALVVCINLLDELPYDSELHFFAGILFYNIGDIETSKKYLAKAYSISQREVYARELFLVLEGGRGKIKNLPREIFLEGHIPSAVINHFNKRVDAYFASAGETSKRNRYSHQFFHDVLVWCQQSQNGEFNERVLRDFVQHVKGRKAVLNALISFFVPETFKKQCISAMVESGCTDNAVDIIIDGKHKQVILKAPPALFSDTHFLDEEKAIKNGKKKQKNKKENRTVADNALIVESFAEAFSTLAVNCENFEDRLKEVAEVFCFYFDQAAKTKRKLLSKQSLSAALVFSVCSDQPLKGLKLSDPISHNRLSVLSLVAEDFNVTSSQIKKVFELLIEE